MNMTSNCDVTKNFLRAPLSLAKRLEECLLIYTLFFESDTYCRMIVNSLPKF